MNRIVEIAGQKFGKLTVISMGGTDYRGLRWLCKCDCGRYGEFNGVSLRNGRIRSCGCLRSESLTKHGHAKAGSSTYTVWSNMIQRCKNEKAFYYFRYGGRGIKVCDRWFKFENFLADMGEKPKNRSLDRINNNGNYEPDNCRWATSLQQNRNREKGLEVSKRYSVGIKKGWERRRLRIALCPKKLGAKCKFTVCDCLKEVQI